MARLVREAIDLALLQTTAARDGALCLFTGVVRDENAGRRVLRLEYEAFEEMALGMMEDLEREAMRRWPVTSVRTVHRLGSMGIGETSVAVAVASPHRVEAFEACRFVIDTLKATVPIWKKEFYADGSEWLEPVSPPPGSARS